MNRFLRKSTISAISQKSLFDPEYNAYLEKHDVTKVHSGYFSVDKKGKAIDSKEAKDQAETRYLCL